MYLSCCLLFFLFRFKSWSLKHFSLSLLESLKMASKLKSHYYSASSRAHVRLCVGVFVCKCVRSLESIYRRKQSKRTNDYLTRYTVRVAANMTLERLGFFDFVDFKIKGASFCFKTSTHTLASPGSLFVIKFSLYLSSPKFLPIPSTTIHSKLYYY